MICSLDTVGSQPVLDPHLHKPMEDRVSLDISTIKVLDSLNGVPPDGVTEMTLGQLIEPPLVECLDIGRLNIGSWGAHTKCNLPNVALDSFDQK